MKAAKTLSSRVEPDQIEATLARAGIQPTAQRIAICRYALCEARHPNADEIKKWADAHFPKISLATVYNTLNTLVKAGLLIELKLPHSESVIYDNCVAEHYHFLDEKTAKIYDLSADEVEIKPKLKRGFRVRGVEVLIRGQRLA